MKFRIASEGFFSIRRETGSLIAAAIHAGHELRPDLAELTALDEETRLREEDPFTDGWLGLAPNRIAVSASRFEVDLNRPREAAVYLGPDQAWGMEPWREPLPRALIAASLERWDRFYREVERLVGEVVEREGAALLIDLHSYCHRRAGPGAPPDDPDLDPEINLGTESIDRRRHGAALDVFAGRLRDFDFGGRGLDVRENVRFRGGHFPRWVNARFGGRACAIAVEVKKVFMDEWTGRLDRRAHRLLGEALAGAARAAEAELVRNES
ncbi:MAG: N-formylglutamate amidohydrolase [Polyangia bacterium]